MANVFRDHLLANKVAVATGGSSGIGLGIMERLAEQGATVVLIGKTQEETDAPVAMILATGGKAMGLGVETWK